MYCSYGFPRALATGLSGPDEECIYCSQPSPDYVVLVFSSAVQVWSGSQHCAKVGEVRRSGDALAQEGPNLRAHWCPQKRVLAVATSRSHLQLYALNVSSEALWRLPDGQELRRVNLYLSHSLHMDYGAVTVADLGGDARSLLVVLSNGTMQVFSWQGQLRGQANPFIAAYEGSRSRRQAARTASLALGTLGGAATATRTSPFASADGLAGSGGSSASLPAAGPAAAPSRESSSAALEQELGSGGLGLLTAADSLPLPTPAQPAEVAVARVHYAPAARMLAIVLQDGRCVLCRTADAGVHPAEALQLFRWVYRPAGPAAPAAVAAALNPTAQLLAVGLSHGRIAIYTLQSLLAVRQPRRDSGSAAPGGGGGSGAPEPARLLSLSDWGFRSAVVGPAAQLRWSPDGQVLAAGYGGRGLAVWTPSGCRLMCTLRQAAATAPPAAAAADTHSLQASTPLPPPAGTAAAGTAAASTAAAGTAAGDSNGAEQLQRKSVEGGVGGLGWPLGGGGGPSQTTETGVLEGACSALAWSAAGYQLLAAESRRPGVLYQLEFARHVAGSHRVLQAAAATGGGTGAGPDEVHVLQAADRILLVTEARQAGDPSLRPPPAAAASSGEAADGEGGAPRPDLSVQHVKLPQQYLDAAYPLLHAAISQDCGDVAVAGTCGLALYSRRARRWRLFGDATQERSLRVHRLLWLPSGVVAAVAHVEGRGGKEAGPQLLLYPQYHLDNASLLARVPLKQVPVAMDAVGWHLLLAFAPLEVQLYRVAVEGALGPQGRPTARLDLLRELSILGLANPLQEIALVDPASLAPTADTSATPSSGSSSAQLQQQGGTQREADARGSGAGDGAAGADASWPQLKVATRPRPPAADEAARAEGQPEAPQLCVLLRAGGILSKLDLQEGTEVLLSDAIERFWLPISAAAAAGGAPAPPAPPQAPPLAGSDSTASLARAASEAELSAGGSAPLGSFFPAATEPPGQPPRVEMPWWCYGPRGMQLWFPSSLSDPLTPSLRALSLASPTRTGLAAAAAAAATNSTDPELEFDREVYPIGVSLAEVSIVGMMQRTVRSQAFPPTAPQSLCLHPLPESQPVLPCLLRRLLQRGRADDALELARWHSGGPHFNRSLEWLLFTALELDAEQRPTPAGAAEASPHGAGRPRFNSSYGVTVGAAPAPSQQARGGQQQPAAAGPLLAAAARLLAAFPQFAEVVVSVARKTDATLWPALFAAVGSPARMCQGLLQAEKLQSAACCLVIVEHIEGRAQAQAQALQLIQAALAAGQYGLASDLLRFLVPPGEAELAAELALEAQQRAAAAASEGGQAHASQRQRRQQQEQAKDQPRGEEEGQASVGGAAAGQPGAQEEQQAQQGGSWFWGLFGGGGGGGAGGEPAAAPQDPAPSEPPLEQQQQQQQQQQTAAAQEGEEDEEGGAAAEAWRLTAAHAWRLLDSGALRDAAQLARALSDLHGGLAALLGATAGEAPEAAAQLAPSAAAAASALFVASNEFAAVDRDAELALAAEQLLTVCQDAGCVNLAAALALLLGDRAALRQLADAHPRVWADLHSLLANDVHLCGYAPVLSPLPSPMLASAAAAAARMNSASA